MNQYVSRFILNYATITPLRLLTRQDTPWKWGKEEQKALEELKEVLVGDQAMSYLSWYNDSHTMVAKPIIFLELHYTINDPVVIT